MAKATDKNESIDNYLSQTFGINRKEAIKNEVCVAEPIGCGEPVFMEDFTNEISQREYKISGLCEKCQNSFFTAEEDEIMEENDEEMRDYLDSFPM